MCNNIYLKKSNNTNPFIKKYLLLKNAEQLLNLQWFVIFSLVEGLNYCDNNPYMTQRHRHREQTCRHNEGRMWGELREQHWNVYITMCKIVSGKLLHNTGNSTQCLWQPRVIGWGWVGGREYQEGEMYAYLRVIHIVVWQKQIGHCKAIILQLKTDI